MKIKILKNGINLGKRKLQSTDGQLSAPSRAMTFAQTAEQQQREMCEQLGVSLSSLNAKQRRLLIAMGQRPMTQKARLSELAAAR